MPQPKYGCDHDQHDGKQCCRQRRYAPRYDEHGDHQHESECKPEMVRSENADSLQRPNHKHQYRQHDGQRCQQRIGQAFP
ncbi:MAG TPA: hypothetical protein VNX23_06950 [Bradyrhizobium sp.]|uniref:hypothetical protein n=1 Tax=Bradyrhizobium sp. TaxID=376 RepID=UPI002B667684|nr:hypothetical protein [Bradyrhizobium sp.]HXB77133.1 hypothetical protein [Bradyrhizobium sp.]